MKKNFIIDMNSVEITHAHHSYDLHNCYIYAGLELDSRENSLLSLHFTKSKGSWVKESDPQNITLLFESINFFEVSRRFFVENLQTLEEMGYKNSNDFDYDWLGREQSNEERHLVFRFESDEYLRIFSERATIKTT